MGPRPGNFPLSDHRGDPEDPRGERKGGRALRDIDPGCRKLILVCGNERDRGAIACSQGGGAAIHARIKEAIRARGLSRVVRVSRTGCLGRCAEGPTVAVSPDGRWYGSLTPEDADEIILRHVEV